MKSPNHPAARRALALYETAPRGDRVHVRVRWWSCPFTAVERAVPAKGRILEVGCGHGLLSLYLALTSSGRDVTGVDIDAGKIELARAAARGLRPGEARVAFEVAGAGTGSQGAGSAAGLPAGPYDAVVVADVLYLLQPEDRRNLLVACAAQLAPGGVLLVKETATTPRWKGALTVAQERLSTGVLGITEGDGVDFAPPEELAGILAGAGLATHIRRIDRGYPHPHVLITARHRIPGANGVPGVNKVPGTAGTVDDAGNFDVDLRSAP